MDPRQKQDVHLWYVLVGTFEAFWKPTKDVDKDQSLDENRQSFEALQSFIATLFGILLIG